MEVAEAFGLISRAIDTGHAAHGYLIVGEVRGNCAELAELILEKLFPDDLVQIRAGSHPDVVSLAPIGKSRTIKIERGKDDSGPGMRDGLLDPMSTTSFSGGWKVGIIYGADRMRTESANAFLKSLEEPTPKTMYLLLTDQPDAILPTIISRTQRVDLQLPPGLLGEEDLKQVADLFAARDAFGLAAKLADLKDAVEDEEVAFVRKSFYRSLISFVREMMIRQNVPRYLAFRNIEAVEQAYRRSEQSINDESVLSFMMDSITFPL